MFYTQNANQLYAVKGDFAPPIGEIKKEENTYSYIGAEYEIRTVILPHDTGVFRREDTFINTSDRPLTLYSALSRFTYAGADFEVYTQRSEWIEESVGAWQPLHTAVAIQNDDLRFNTGAAPFLARYNSQEGSGVAYHLLADSSQEPCSSRQYLTV